MPIDDYACVLGMKFLDGVQAIPMPFADSICIMEKENVCIILVIRSRVSHGNTLSTIQLAK